MAPFLVPGSPFSWHGPKFFARSNDLNLPLPGDQAERQIPEFSGRQRQLQTVRVEAVKRRSNPTIPQLHKNIGDLYYRAGRLDEAFDAYQRAVQADENLGGDVYFKLGNIRLRRQQREEATQCWERALHLAPGNAIVRTNLEALKRAG